MLKLNGAKIEIKNINSRYGRTEYSIELIEGNWPSDDDLITLCDNHHNGTMTVHHFGGSVRKTSGKTANVTVFID
jgi:hypothetical protein